MRKAEDITIDDLKTAAGTEHADFMDEQVNNMLALVKEHESEQDYWFVKYYLAQSFAIFTMGAMAANINEKAWIKPWEKTSMKLKESTIEMLKAMVSKEIWELFKDKEDLAFHLFGYGTHQVQTDQTAARMEEEKEKAKRIDWTYAVFYLHKDKNGTYSGGASFLKSEIEAAKLYSEKEKGKGTLLMMMHISQTLLPIVQKIEDPEEFILITSKHKDDCVLLRFNDEVIDFLGHN